ncbi:MAG: acylphosphatase [Candidatus Diapherotrites archaeon]
MTKQRLEAMVKGRVQGVGYRLFVKLKAAQLGINGYAKNLPNGDVEVVAEGNSKALEELLKELYKGPFLARVEEIKSEIKNPKGENGFKVL